MADVMPKAQFEFVTKVKNDMLKNTNMTEDEAWDFGFRCWQMGYAKVEKKTNADRIRAMSDEELADFLEEFEACDVCKYYDKNRCTFENPCVHEFAGIMIWEWLKSPKTD
jgi:hypothetical protein